MPKVRKGRQTPTKSIVLPYAETRGQEAIDLYNDSGRTAQEWQELLTYDILAVNADGLWVHTKYGEEIPRRNGKNEVVVIREMWGLTHGEKILHTAHRTTTSTSAARRLAARLVGAGYEEVARIKKGEKYSKHFTYTKQLGMERIVLLGEGGGTIDFRTRSSSGGLGEGFDLLVIDEAQEYTDNQETALKYVVTDSKNPQTIFCGTPPTTVSAGTVFTKLRSAVLQGETTNTGWAEWSVDEMTDPGNKEAWYETNPSLGTILTERAIQDEIGTDKIDFNMDAFNAPVYAESPTEVKNVLVCPVSTEDIITDFQLYGKRAEYELCIPKGDTHVWENRTVEFFGKKWRTFGIPLEWMEHRVPLPWNKRVKVERYG